MMALHKLKLAFKQDPLRMMPLAGANAALRVKGYDETIFSQTIHEEEQEEYSSPNEIAQEKQPIKKEIDTTNIKVFITSDRNLLNEYYKLRNDIFQNERGWIKKTWFENDYDRNGAIIVVLDPENKVIGGARVMVSINGSYLSGEIAGTEFVYSNLFKKMNLDLAQRYSEIDGLIVAEDYRKRNVTEQILKTAVEYSISFNCAYIVGIAFLPYCRIYRAAYKAIGYGNAEIVKDFVWAELEEYNYSRDFPIVNILRHEPKKT